VKNLFVALLLGTLVPTVCLSGCRNNGASTKLSDYPALEEYVASLKRIPVSDHESRDHIVSNSTSKTVPPLASFRLGSTPITNAMWNEYCQATGKMMPKRPAWGYPDDYPVVNVSWLDIMGTNRFDKGFCSWASEVSGIALTLPTKNQLEVAACSGRCSNKFPWGAAMDPKKVWSSVGSNALSAAAVNRTRYIFLTRYGVSDIVGNVYQWCADLYDGRADSSGRLFDKQPDWFARRSLYGGSWSDNDESAFFVETRCGNLPAFFDDNIGFRLVCE
jgi:formylglycine-generating enzyme required for sulfatase activity